MKKRVVVHQITQNPVDRAAPLELPKHRLDHAPNLLVGILEHLSGRRADITARQERVQLPPACLRALALEHALLEDMQLRFRHRPLQSQQQPIVVRLRIIDPVGIPDQGREQSAHLQQLIPVPRAARQARDLDAQNDADMIQTDFGHQPLKAGPTLGARPGTAQILIDQEDLRGGPAQLHRPIHQGVLQPGRLLVALHLLQRGLAHVDHGLALQMRGLDLSVGRVGRRTVHGREDGAHRRSPLPSRLRSADVRPSGSAGQSGALAAAAAVCSNRSEPCASCR